MPDIRYLPGKDMFPRFGVCFGNGTIWINEDLPESAQAFVLAHELYHSGDVSSNWLKRELRANLAGFWAAPWGFLVTAVLSLAPYRLKYYWQRFMEGR
jgi:hypothetical protein